MSMFSDFAGGFVGGVKDVVDQNIANNMEMERYKKQLEIQEEMRKKAEEAKVAACRMFNVGGEQGPPQLMMEEYNSAGARIGNARPANPLEKESFAANQQAGAVDRINAADKQMWDLEQRQIKRDKADLDKRKGEQSIRTSKASEQYMRSGGGGNATPKAKDPDKVMNDIQTLLRYPENIAAIEAVDPTLLKRIQGGGTSGIDNAIKSGLAYFGAKPQEADGSLWSELEAAGDDELRAQILYGVKRELDAALARGRAGKKGMKPEAGGNSFVANGGLDNKGQ